MGDIFTDEELITEEKRARKLADVCFLYGQMDGGKAMRSVADALAQEQTVRARKRGE